MFVDGTERVAVTRRDECIDIQISENRISDNHTPHHDTPDNHTSHGGPDNHTPDNHDATDNHTPDNHDATDRSAEHCLRNGTGGHLRRRDASAGLRPATVCDRDRPTAWRRRPDGRYWRELGNTGSEARARLL